ncbi:hypothetical protein [Streptomyces mayteni]
MQNRTIAKHMRRYFGSLSAHDRADTAKLALRYGTYWWSTWRDTLKDEKALSRSRFHIALSTGNDIQAFTDLTKRVVLVTDTLLLSHKWSGAFHELGTRQQTIASGPPRPRGIADEFRDIDLHIPGRAAGAALANRYRAVDYNNQTTTYGMRCPDLDALGGWIRDSEPLLTAGLAWYLPSYSTGGYRTVAGVRQYDPGANPRRHEAIDYLIRDGRAVDASGAEPIKSQLIRPLLRAELPFIQGVSLRDFSNITVQEFGSYTAFRDFLRLRFIELDGALNAVQSEREIVKLALHINDGIRAVGAEMANTRRKRAVAASGAVLGSVGTILVAVYGPALAAAVAAVGAGGGLWGIINSFSEHSMRDLRENKWYYVWVLDGKKAD